MAPTRIDTFDAHPATVYEAVLDTAEAAGLSSHVVDGRALQAAVTRSGKAWRISVAITDNGLGQAVLHLSWEPAGSTGGRKFSKALARGVAGSLAELAPPPPPAPPTAR